MLTRVLKGSLPALVLVGYIPLLNVGDGDLLWSSTTAWGWSIALAGSMVFLALRLVGLVPASSALQATPAERATSSLLCWRSTTVLVPFVIAVAFLHSADVAWEDLSRSGVFIVAYSASRLVLLVGLLIVCLSYGSLFLRLLLGRDSLAALDDGTFVLLCFFAGASLASLSAVFLGALGLLSLPTALLMVLPALLLARQPVARILFSLRQWIGRLLRDGGLQGWIQLQMLWCTCVSGLFLLLSRGLYPAPTSNDVWEHYLPYFRQVLQSGSIGPNDLWYHYHSSKGAGLFFLAGSLSDELAPQLVSWCFILLAGIVVYRVLTKLGCEVSWSLLGMTLFFSVYRGDFFKHHDVLTGLMAFLVWASIELIDSRDGDSRAISVASGPVAFYVGFYQSVGAAIVAVFWTLLLLVHAVIGRRRDAILFTRLLALLVGGVLSTFTLNYIATGLAEANPIRLFWSLADIEKFQSVFGLSGIASLLYTDLERVKILSWPPTWRYFEQAFRYQHFWVFLTPWIAVLIVGVSALRQVWNVRRRRLPTVSHLLGVLFAFVLSALLLPVFVQNVSLPRLYVFTTFLMTLSVILLLRWLVNALSVNAVRSSANAIFLCLLGLHAVGQSVWYTERIWRVSTTSIIAFYLGERSFEDVLRETDGRFRKQITFDETLAIRRLVGPDAKIMNLGADPGPVYSFPGAGLIGGVSHTFGPDHLDIVFGTSEDAQTALRKKGWNHFLLNLRSGFLDCMPFSVLFQPENLDTHFSLAYQRGDTYLITWRQQGDSTPLPARLRQVFELKQTAALRYPFTGDYERAIAEVVLQKVRSLSETHAGELSAAVADRLVECMNSDLTVRENGEFLAGLAWHVERSLTSFEPELYAAARLWSQQVPVHDPLTVYQQELTRSLLDLTRRLVSWYCEREYGPALATVLMRDDERDPFGHMYASREAFAAVVGTETSDTLHTRPFKTTKP